MKRLTVLALILILAVGAVFATNPKGSHSYDFEAFIESNGLTVSAGGNTSYVYYLAKDFGFVGGLQAQAVNAVYGSGTEESPYRLGVLRPMVTPFLMLRYKNFEIGGGAGFATGESNFSEYFSITPYVKADVNFDFTQDSGEAKDRKLGMIIGADWYFNTNNDGSEGGDALADILANILIPKIHIGVTYKMESGK